MVYLVIPVVDGGSSKCMSKGHIFICSTHIVFNIALQHMWKKVEKKGFCDFRGSCAKSGSLSWWLSCIMGNIGTRF